MLRRALLSIRPSEWRVLPSRDGPRVAWQYQRLSSWLWFLPAGYLTSFIKYEPNNVSKCAGALHRTRNSRRRQPLCRQVKDLFFFLFRNKRRLSLSRWSGLFHWQRRQFWSEREIGCLC